MDKTVFIPDVHYATANKEECAKWLEDIKKYIEKNKNTNIKYIYGDVIEKLERKSRMKTQEEINELIRQWERDPCWDIEDTEGFEDHARELLVYSKQKKSEWEKQKQEEIDDVADSLGVSGNVKLACAFIALKERIEALEERAHNNC